MNDNLPTHSYVLLICIDGLVIDSLPILPAVATDPDAIISELCHWAERQGYSYAQAALADNRTFQLDFTTGDGETAATAFAAVFAARRQ